jgi:hypothetical protein
VFVVDGVSLKYSTLPNEGFVQIVTKYSGNKNVCWQSLKNQAATIVCRQLGYISVVSNVNKAPSSENMDVIFSGSIECNGGEKNISQCSITISNGNCSQISYIKCKFYTAKKNTRTEESREDKERNIYFLYFRFYL